MAHFSTDDLKGVISLASVNAVRMQSPRDEKAERRFSVGLGKKGSGSRTPSKSKSVFEVVTVDRTYVFAAETEGIAQRWVDALTSAMGTRSLGETGQHLANQSPTPRIRG